MEPASTASRLPLPENLRSKQREAIEAFATVTDLVIQLPTGYGKTLTAAGCFAQLRQRSACNRMLYVVPRRRPADQAAEDLPEALATFGVETKAIIVGDGGVQAIKAHTRNTMCVFIVTIQSLLTSATWSIVRELMQTGRWFLCIDEHHHYSDDLEGAWATRIRELNHSAILAMSATANRHDGSDFFRDPDLRETYRAAASQGYVKRLSLHAYHYTIDAVTVDGRIVQYTTEGLAEEAGSSEPEAVDAFLTSRKLRFSPKYVSPLVTFPLDRLIDLRTKGVRSQMLVQAMSCWHARTVFDQIKMLVPEHISVDWVGTGPAGRPVDENAAILKRFCPPKDKLTSKRPWDLDILINVGMAGEALDTVDVTEVSFLTPANLTISNKQAIGRAARVMAVDPRRAQPTAHINVDTGSPLAEFIGDKIMSVFDDPIEFPEAQSTEREPSDDAADYQELPEQLGWTIADVRLIDIRSEDMFRQVFARVRKEVDLARSDDEVAAIVEAKLHEYLNRSNNASAIYAQKRQQLESALSKIAGLVIRRLSASGMRIERTLAGDLRRRINTRKKLELGAVPDADDSELDRHWQWIKRLEQKIVGSPGLDGVPQWLR
jgi:superfamily II DNA or RNA helicase